MGGSAFQRHSPPLPTPRMPDPLYELVLNQTRLLLLTNYLYAESPIESPGKETHGDIDILVTGAFHPSFDPIANRLLAAQSLAKLLSAEAYISERGNPVLNFAIHYPEEPGRYIQIDVHYLPDYPQFQWELFHSAHGDLWNMLGSTIRPFGLTVNDTGLYLRIEEIEKLDRNKAKVFLTSDSAAILQFLGLDEEKWGKKFESKEALFEYAAGSRFFWVKPAPKEEDGKDKENEETATPQGEGGEGTKDDLKRSDRKRVTQRPVFAQWIEDFIPRCRASGKYTTSKFTRHQTRLDAFERFGVEKEYTERLHNWELAKHKDELWKVAIKGNIPEEGVDPQVRGAAARVFKSIVIEGGGVKELLVPSEVRVKEDGFWDLEKVGEWVRGNWEEAGKIGMDVLRQKSVEKQREKEKKEKQVVVVEVK